MFYKINMILLDDVKAKTTKSFKYFENLSLKTLNIFIINC